ncbi:MAG: methyltransferase domain-containing protein [SAR324 cluster bacterium]|nr:methyltransferase domain-containing protein [SAR324 cluster bacterium]
MASGDYRQFFQGLVLELWRQATPPERTAEEAEFLAGAFADRPGARLLDVPCGGGRLALALAERGFRLTGVDQAPEQIAAARAASERQGQRIEWREADMRRLRWRSRFGGAFCCGNSFGIFDRVGTEAFFGALARALEPGGRFVLDTEMTAETALPHLEERVWIPLGDLIVLAENRYDPAESCLDTHYTIIHQGKRETRLARHWIFTIAEIRRMLADAGLATLELYESLERTPFSFGAERLILVAEKRGRRVQG